MKANFNAIFKKIIGHEGGYSNDPDDRGGATRYGVTIEVLSRWRGKRCTPSDVSKLKLSEAQEIFRARYWDLVKGDVLPTGLDYVVVDFAYNSGVNRSSKLLQATLAKLGLYDGPVDGQIGRGTLKAVDAIADIHVFIERFQAARLAFLKTTYGWWKYKNGWSRRVKEVRADSLAMADGDAPVVAALTRVPALDEDPKAATVSKTQEKAGLQTAGMGGAGSMMTETANQLAPHIEAFTVLKVLFIVLTLAGAGIAAWAYYRSQASVGGDDTDDSDARRAADAADKEMRSRC